MHWWARPVGYPWIPGTEGILAQPGVAPHTQGLKVLYKSSSCCPCSVSGAKRRRKSRREGRSPRLTVLQLLRVPAEHRAGKCSWKRAFPSWKMSALSIPQEHPPGTSSAGQVREGPTPFPALPGELRAPCTLLTGLQVPQSSSTMKTKTNPKAVLLEQSWSQVLVKLRNSPSTGGLLPALPCKSCRKALRNHPLPQGSPCGWWHLPPSLSQPS